MSAPDIDKPRSELRTFRVYPVPTVCSALWTDEDFERVAETRSEPCEIVAIGYVWRSQGERDAGGQLLYRRAEKAP